MRDQDTEAQQQPRLQDPPSPTSIASHPAQQLPRVAGDAGPSQLGLLATLRFCAADAPAAPVSRLRHVHPPGRGGEPCLLALGGQPKDMPDELIAFTSLQAGPASDQRADLAKPMQARTWQL